MPLLHWCGRYVCICILVVLVFACTLAFGEDKTSKEECTKEKITYDYTECKDNGRWKVAVPKSPDCKISTPEPPVFHESCILSCKLGEFFDEETQSCSQCRAGTYSLGNGIRFDRWDVIPEGFSVSTSSSSFPEFGYEPKVTNCSMSGWTPRNGYISSGIDDCSSTLTYTADITSKGSLTFKYQNTDEDLILHFFVRNSGCKISPVSPLNAFLDVTGASWKKYSVQLNKGLNLISWKSTGLLLGGKTQLRPALIKEIEIYGVSYTKKCHPCRPGYYADSQGSDYCKACDPGYYSEEGATQCSKCDEKVEYSYPASPECIARPPCFVNDYFTTLSPCQDGSTNVSYSWNSPKLCRNDLENSIDLPPSGLKKGCPPCNPGFYIGSSGCEPCPAGTYSKDGNSTCKKCEIGSHPNFGFLYHWWNKLPSNMVVSCLTIHKETCIGKQGWVANGGMIATTSNEAPVAYLLLKLNILGFRSMKKNAGGDVEYGKMNFLFELKCFDDCVLYLMKNTADATPEVLSAWHKSTQSSFEYIFRTNETMTITWAYQKTSRKYHDADKYSGDKAIIYSLDLYNEVTAPAIDCISCGGGTDESGCVPCAAGHRIDESSKTCVNCPTNTILSHETIQSENCSECPIGTVSNGAQTACENDCTYHSSISNRSYEFPELLKTQLSVTPPSFSGGHKYVHYYNFSICGNGGFGKAWCASNKTNAATKKLHVEKVSGMICRSTKFTSMGDESKDMQLFSEPEIVGSVLNGVHEDTSMNSTSVNTFGCEFEIFPPAKELPFHDIVYEFSHPTSSNNCPNGSTAYVHLRCNPEISIEDATLKMPKNYPEGSCDGCNFHFLWESEGACPTCEVTDYYAVKSACENGYITTKYLWHSYPKTCRGGSLPDDSQTPCTDIKLYIEMGVLAGIALLVFMMVTTLVFWRRNRNLEYKYQRLVGTSEGSSDLKGAETCAVSNSESDNSDDEAVVFRKKRAKMMKKDETVPLNRSQNFLKM